MQEVCEILQVRTAIEKLRPEPAHLESQLKRQRHCRGDIGLSDNPTGLGVEWKKQISLSGLGVWKCQG